MVITLSLLTFLVFIKLHINYVCIIMPSNFIRFFLVSLCNIFPLTLLVLCGPCWPVVWILLNWLFLLCINIWITVRTVWACWELRYFLFFNVIFIANFFEHICHIIIANSFHIAICAHLLAQAFFLLGGRRKSWRGRLNSWWILLLNIFIFL